MDAEKEAAMHQFKTNPKKLQIDEIQIFTEPKKIKIDGFRIFTKVDNICTNLKLILKNCK